MLARRHTEDEGPVGMLDREFNRMLNRFWGSAEVPATLAPYAVDVHEDADHFYVEAELPGFTANDIDITLEDGVLTIRGERKMEEKSGDQNKGHDGGRQPLHIERRWSRFERSFSLPTMVNEGAVHAALNDGLLTVTLDKREEVKPRKIQISGGANKAPQEIKAESKPAASNAGSAGNGK